MIRKDILYPWGGLFLLTLLYNLFIADLGTLGEPDRLLNFVVSVVGLYLIPVVCGLVLAGLFYLSAGVWPPWTFLVTAMLWGGLTAIHYAGVTHQEYGEVSAGLGPEGLALAGGALLGGIHRFRGRIHNE